LNTSIRQRINLSLLSVLSVYTGGKVWFNSH